MPHLTLCVLQVAGSLYGAVLEYTNGTPPPPVSTLNPHVASPEVGHFHTVISALQPEQAALLPSTVSQSVCCGNLSVRKHPIAAIAGQFVTPQRHAIALTAPQT